MTLIAKLMDVKMDAEIWFTRTKRKYTRKLIHWLQPGAERFYCWNGRLLVISDPGKREHRCNICFNKAMMINPRHNRFACFACNIWLETPCEKENCQRCKELPHDYIKE